MDATLRCQVGMKQQATLQMGTLQKLTPQNPKGALPSAILVNKAEVNMCPELDRLRSKRMGRGLEEDSPFHGLPTLAGAATTRVRGKPQAH